MASILSIDNTLLDVFVSIARSDGIERNVLECGDESWTYGDLDAISTGLALELHQKYGPKPVVAVISENHPYVLAILFATWKLGGVFAPLDYHVPREILERMLFNIAPTCVLAPSTEPVLQKILKDLSLPCLPFDLKDTTVTALSQRYLDQAPKLLTSLFPVPTPEDIALYLHTSSASTVSNVKCVPISHKNVINGSQSRLSWFKRVWPQQDFNNLRVLGWSPWSHIIGLSHDIGAATLLTAGCYVFGVIPSSYPTGDDAKNASRYLDVPTQLLDTAISTKTTAFAGVPWVLEGFMKAWKNESDEARKARIMGAIELFKVFGAGGASTSEECIEWAKRVGLPVLIDLGMTEVGGPLFHSDVNSPQGWFAHECLVPDAELSLIDEQGKDAAEGELVIKSHIISKGYLRFDNSAFTIGSDGAVTFRTGDVYGRSAEQRLIWKGRKEDYIQMSSGESIDPRVIEAALDQCPAIVRSCVVGNNFLGTSSQFICAIIEPASDSSNSSTGLLSEITRAIASANRGLAPPLRISWARVLVLKGQHIPVTKKGAIFRKKLEEVFGDQLASLNSGSEHESEADVKPNEDLSQGKTKDQVASIISNIVVETLRISAEMLENNSQSTFAELGMDSAMATMIVNKLNRQLNLGLPLNTCHTYIDLVSLTKAIHKNLGFGGSSSSAARPSTEPVRAARSSELKEDIVIVGQAVRLPGDINNAESLWKALIDQRDDIMTPIPEARWDHKSFYRSPDSKNPPATCDITLDRAGFVELAGFDHSFFGISSAEAFHVSPNIRLSMEIAFEALENANIPISKIKGSDMGVFVAAGMDEGYIKLLFADKGWGAYTRFYGTGVATSTACGRISYLLDVHGPSYTVDTACSSGLIILDHAVQYLQSGQAESAIVCGANTHTWPGTFGFLSAQKMTSSNSRCATFTNEADGYVPSEGAAGLILKTKSAAIRDGDNILAVVRSTDVKHDGRSQGLVAPNVKAQIAMQISLLEKANLAPAEIDFIEAHGTGTSLGDLIEIEGINEVFQSSHGSENPLVIGAAKSCVGHAETVSGLVGVIKTLGSFAAGTVPGLVQLRADNMNPSIDCSVVPLHIPFETAELKRSEDRPLRAMILSNGFAGSIAGAVLEAPSEEPKITATEIPDSVPMMFVVSAKSQEALLQYLNNYLDFCLDADASLFHSICYTSCVGREHYRYRFACVATNMQDLIARIEERIRVDLPVSAGNARRILMGFPGQGSQYQGMGRYLAQQYSGFNAIITDAANKASVLTGYPVLPFLVDQSAPRGLSIDQSEVAQICIFIFQYSVCTWLESLGIHAHAVLGHSLGEIAAAVIAGAFSFEVGLQFVVVRATLLRADPAHPGGMAAVAASEEKVARYISKLDIDSRVAIAVYNGPESHVVSGEMKAIEKLISVVKADGIRATKLVVDQGFHSPSIAPALPALKAWLDEHEASFNVLEKPFFSTLRGKEIAKHEHLGSEYWVNHAKNAVRFVQAARAAHKSSSIDMILDVGPQPTIWSNIQTPEFSEKSRLALTGKRGKNQIVALLSALSSLFEKGFSVEFSELFSQMDHQFTFTQLPTYPFQRLYNYPAYIATRDSLLGVGHHQIESAARQKSPEFVVDQSLCDFLDLHRIEGRRVLPGAAMVDFFARSSSSKTVKSIRFHLPLVLETPETQARAEIDSKGSYTLIQNDPACTRICSGSIAETIAVRTPKKLEKEPEVVPSQMMSKTEIYECFKNVKFGEPFRTVQQVRIWSDHADADIKVSVTENPAHDRIRKLDACLHMFGAIASRVAPEVDDSEGAFLPTSLDDFTLHSHDIPADFMCRYYLPLEVERNGRLLSVSFEVLSHSGELLVSCRKYSVAWVPRGVVIQEQKAVEGSNDSWLRNGWTKQILPAQEDAISNHKFDELLYIGTGGASRVLAALSASAKDTVSINLVQDNTADTNSKVKTLPIDELSTLPQVLRGRDLLIVLDLTASNNVPGSNDFSSFYLQVLSLMKFVMTSKLHITSLVALTSWSAPVDLYKEGLDLFSNSQATPMALVGAVVQGMLRVFRRETGLDVVAWALDLPDVEILSDIKLRSILNSEIQARHRGAFVDTFVSYREDSSDQTLSRLVPSLERIDSDKITTSRSTSGATVIVGMGSIGSALAVALVAADCNKVVFFGRRPDSNPEVIKELSSLPPSARSHCSYRQVDVCDLSALKFALSDINTQFGGVKNIVHTAAVVNDATIASTNVAGFENVLRPKVIGSWNLHIASQDLNLALDSFVLFSSTNVIVGNPGQIAYVSANSFMDSLATYRHNIGLPAASLQLGAWESKLTDNIDMTKSFAFLMKHDEGIPLIMKAMMVPIPLQIIARMDSEKLSATPAYAKDPFFASLLPLSSKTGAAASSDNKLRLSAVEANKIIIDILRVALELQPNERLDTAEPLTSCGADSITFAQFKGQILKELEVDVPMVFLSDSYTISEMINNILESYGLPPNTQ